MRHSRQPQYLAPIDWSNPITRGLISVIDGRSNRDLLGNAPPTANTASSSYGGNGKAIEYGSGTYETFALNRSKIVNAVSYVTLTDYTPPGTPNSFLFGDVQASGTGYNSGLYSNGSVFSFFVKTGGAGTAASGTTSSGFAIANLLHGGSYDGANIRVYVQGKLEGTAAKTGNVDAGAFSLNINRWNTASLHGGKFYLGLVWNRSLTADEHASLRANPWQIFQAPARRKFAPTAAGGDVSVALTGTAATASIGTLSPATDKALTGSSATTGQGDMVAEIGVVVALTGQEMTAAIGSVSPSNTVALSGSEATASPGTVVATPTFGLTGQEATTEQGSVTQSRTVPLAGEAMIGEQGDVGVVGDVTVALTGQAMTMGQGDLDVESGALRHFKRRQYIVRRKDELFVFDNPFDAQAFEAQGKPPLVAPIGKGPRRTPKLVKAPAPISIPAVVEAAPDWAKQQLQKMIAEAQYARLLDMVAELEEEDELELILLNL